MAIESAPSTDHGNVIIIIDERQNKTENGNERGLTWTIKKKSLIIT